MCVQGHKLLALATGLLKIYPTVSLLWMTALQMQNAAQPCWYIICRLMAAIFLPAVTTRKLHQSPFAVAGGSGGSIQLGTSATGAPVRPSSLPQNGNRSMMRELLHCTVAQSGFCSKIPMMRLTPAASSASAC